MPIESTSKPRIFTTIHDAAEWIGNEYWYRPKGTGMLSVAAPLGLGKPNQLLNALYKYAKEHPENRLEIFTALSLQIPKAKSELERRFLGDFTKRHFGSDYPELQYAVDASEGKLPDHVKIFEFYFQAGKALSKFELQRNHISLNYTHVTQTIMERNVQILVCLIAKNPKTGATYSLSSNPDLTLDLFDSYRRAGKHLAIVGVVHPDLPFMSQDSEVTPNFFDAIVESDEVTHGLFAIPREPVTDEDYMIGLQASLLIQDGGTIQLGIGSLSDALTYATLLRQNEPKIYQEITNLLMEQRFKNSSVMSEFQNQPFQEGLYGISEMVMDAFMHLRKNGILKREVYDSDPSLRRYLHGAFFLGSKTFYQWMKNRFEEGDTGLCMTRVSKVNDLYDPHEHALRRQRKKARFFNMCMNVTLLGSAASDTLEDGQVVSGVGGQYNFVAMSHELPDSHSVLMLRSQHNVHGKRNSNIVWGHGQLTIPRHLRDVFITEYGIAFTRGSPDEEVIKSLIEISDSEFQDELRNTAVRNGKLSENWMPSSKLHKNNSETIQNFLAPWKEYGYFPTFPFGSDFNPVEEKIMFALQRLKAARESKIQLLRYFWVGCTKKPKSHLAELERMQLLRPKNLSEWFYQKLLLGVLQA